MILFKPEHIPMVKNGIKTQTRRKGKPRWKIGSIHQAKENFKKGSKPFAHIEILAVRREPLGSITEADAKAEGYSSVEEYKKVFQRIYGDWNPDEVVNVVDFRRVMK
ncbi:MAG: ASCH domain-containing protein [Firmicutes bacterium]|nr:ASCH domain-containing protein [Bacillota bacterium]